MARQTLTEKGTQKAQRIHNPVRRRLFTLREGAEYLPAGHGLSIRSESLPKIHRQWSADCHRMGKEADCHGSRVVFEEGLGIFR
jgi:hypothetical protein